MRKKGSYVFILVLLLQLCGCAKHEKVSQETTTGEITKTVEDSVSNQVAEESESTLSEEVSISNLTVEELVSKLTIEEKAAQMVQAAVYSITTNDMEQGGYGSVLSAYSPQEFLDTDWRRTVDGLQQATLKSKTGIPFIYGNDSVHGVNTCKGAVVFPHNIGVGAANDADLTYAMGKAVANEMKLTGMLWNFSPCVAVADEPRWGRTYESYSSEVSIVRELSTAYTKGMIDGGIVACAKHFIGDGSIEYDTGEGDNLVDRGDAVLEQKELDGLLSIYQSLIDAGVPSIMVNHGSVNGIKMHMHKELITDTLKGKMNFQGVVISDWESIHNLPDMDLKEQVITSINAGIDMLMEPELYKECRDDIVEGYEEGLIPLERIDDAVTRILTMKKNAGLMDDPLLKKLTSEYTSVGSDEVRAIARKMVEESLVLLKNDGNLLPIKSGLKLYITGPAADDTGVLCGGWTLDWQGKLDTPNSKVIKNGTTILEGFETLAEEYNLTIITDPTKAKEADIAVLCIGEKPYAEWLGDTADMSITGSCAMENNMAAIQNCQELGLPTVTLLVAGRQILLEDYMKDWDGVVMCYLPGSEGDGIANVLTGKKEFCGKLPMPWYQHVDDIKTENVLFPVGYGLSVIE